MTSHFSAWRIAAGTKRDPRMYHRQIGVLSLTVAYQGERPGRPAGWVASVGTLRSEPLPDAERAAIEAVRLAAQIAEELLVYLRAELPADQEIGEEHAADVSGWDEAYNGVPWTAPVGVVGR